MRHEDLLALIPRGVRRLVLLVSLLHGFMAELRDRAAAVADGLAGVVKSFGKLPLDPRYRIIRGLGATLDRIARWGMRRWRGKG